LLLVVSAVVWLVVELRESTNRRPEATKSDGGSRQYIRVATIVGVVGAVLLTRNVSSGRISPDLAWLGLLVFWCGIALRFWSFRTLGRYFTFTVQTSADQPVITDGPYRVLRHPSYAAVLLMVMGVGLFLGSWWSFAWLTASVLCGLLFRIRMEERALLLQLGHRYDTYAAGHKRLVPFIW
jgi:protein-S-isoprenylcysteine O-methyltransferase Ste14